MDEVEDHGSGVTEARVGLSIITCLLLVLGYVVLQRLGGTGQRPPVEIRSGQAAESVETDVSPTSGDVEQPFVLTPEVWQPADPSIHTTQRPQWLAPRDDAGDRAPGVLDPLDLPASQLGGPATDQPEPWRASRAPDPDPLR
jgi:hypothetical protein